ncbi:MAG: lysine 2,3-aminomutase [Ardenticatenaceae bacterium]|nr:lysine 2,3-aminomutase [Ardenticatenaceae bacterium]
MTDILTKEAVVRTPRPALWEDVADEAWDDWRWQLKNRVNSRAELEAAGIELTPEEIEGVEAEDKFRLDITPYFASLIDPHDPNCPVRRQVIPLGRELVPFDAMMADSLNEDQHMPVPGLVHRYPDRVLLLVTTQCASYCRYCTRSRIVGDPHENFTRHQIQAALDYLKRTPQVRDVLLSGGDPLTMAPKTLEWVLSELRAIPHIEILRIGSRVPVFMPQRVTDELVDMLAQFHPFYMNIHVNHAREITPELARACDKLTRGGIPLGNQSVLLAGINDCPNIQKKLVHGLLKIRVRPYYLYQCDLVAGAGHFRTPVSKGIEIIEALRGHTTGFAVPTYVIDAPGGGGKVPIMPQYLISQSPERAVVRNFEGFISAYTQPENYQPHDSRSCPDCRAAALAEDEQAGVFGLLEGQHLALTPEGYEEVHRRGRTR